MLTCVTSLGIYVNSDYNSAMTKRYHHGDLAPVLIATAVALIEERGVEHLSLREVAKRAGVSPAAPFRHFPTKAALLAAVAANAMQRLVDAVIQAQARAATQPLAQLEGIGLGYLAWVQAHPTHFEVLSMRHVVELDDTQQSLNDDIRRRMVDLLTQAKDAGDVAADADIDTIVLSCRAFVYGLGRMWTDGHFPEWQKDGDPEVWTRRALSDFIVRLRS